MTLEDLLQQQEWGVVDRRTLPPRDAIRVRADHLPLGPAAQRLLATFPAGLYQHQYDALAAAARSQNVSLSTGTASGKTLVFHAAALDRLERDPDATIAVVYPMRALALQQEARWQDAFARVGWQTDVVGRIDGAVPVNKRVALLQRSRILLLTPDVLHAWMLSTTGEPAVQHFLAHLHMVVLDEVHAYTGVFGSHAAMLSRRLRQAVFLARGAPVQWIAASATMRDAPGHLRRLAGVESTLVGPDRDSSGRHAMDVVLAVPPAHGDLNAHLVHLFRTLADLPRTRFLAFVDSRRQVEQIGAMLRRETRRTDADGADLTGSPDEPEVQPYRSGYEAHDREAIQHGLASGRLKGVVSTSALELGIDIGDLDVGVQVGVPRSTAALLQRLGRVGRAGPGTFLVVLDDGPYDRLIGQRPDALFTRPLEDTTIYLDNRRIQYIHAMCLAGPGGEGETLGGPDWTLDDAVRATLPAEFLELVAAEQTGQVPADLQPLKSDGGHDPWHSFPLRDTGTSFKVELRAMGGAQREPLGSLTYAQVLREAHPGAVYYYQGRPYRVRQVSLDRRQVVVGHEKGYVTRPLLVPPMIYPNTAAGWLGGVTHGGLVAGEVDMQVTESVQGWVEFRGRGRTEHRYPSEHWRRDALRRNFFTTGVCLWHPALDEQEAKTALCLAAALHEAFLAEVPTDTGDVSAGTGVMREPRPPLTSARFITIYDNTYGSLRLTARLFQADVLGRCLTAAQTILANGLEERDADHDIREAAGVYGYPTEVLRRAADVLGQLVTEWGRPGRAIHEGGAVAPLPATDRPLVIWPGDTGILMIGAQEEFVVDKVFLRSDGLYYAGRRAGEPPSDVITSFRIDKVLPIPGRTEMGEYIEEEGTVRPLTPEGQGVGA